MKPLRLALDTNIWLDWLVFEDKSVDAIKETVNSGGALIFISTECEQELARALGYPFGPKTLDIASQNVCLEQCRKVAQMLDRKNGGCESVPKNHAGLPRLPICRDRDDQKFLELAYECRADFLITKDLALLTLDSPDLRFRIIKAQQFCIMADTI